MSIRSFALVPLICVLSTACHRRASQTAKSAQVRDTVANPQLVISKRPVYPYSVIPGGVGSPADIEKAVHADPIVAQHYAGLDTKALKPVKLTRNMAAYVSFRMKGRVYWTSRKVQLAAGEVVFQGKEIGVRGRCGNQVSEQPRQPVLENPKLEPSGETLSTAQSDAVASQVYPSESARTAVPDKLTGSLVADTQTAQQSPVPQGNLGWSAPVNGAYGGGSGIVAVGGGGGGGGGSTGGAGSPVSTGSQTGSLGGGYPVSTGATVVVVGGPSSSVAGTATSNSQTVAYQYLPSTSAGASSFGQVWIATAPPSNRVEYQPPVQITPPPAPQGPPPPPSTPPPANSPPPGTPPQQCPPQTSPPQPVPPGVPEVPPTPINTPEPSTWVTLLTGAGVIGLKFAFAKRNTAQPTRIQRPATKPPARPEAD